MSDSIDRHGDRWISSPLNERHTTIPLEDFLQYFEKCLQPIVETRPGDPPAGDAEEALREIATLRSAVAAGSTKLAAVIALRLGNLIQKIGVYPVAKRGGPMLAGPQKGADAVRQKAADRFRECADELLALRRTEPKLSAAAYCKNFVRKQNPDGSTKGWESLAKGVRRLIKEKK